MPHLNLDKTDLKILQVLQENGRLSNVELSEKGSALPFSLPAPSQTA